MVFGVSSFDTIVFDAQWNSLKSFHSLSELSGLVPPAKIRGGISKVVIPGKFRQLKAFSLLDTVRVVPFPEFLVCVQARSGVCVWFRIEPHGNERGASLKNLLEVRAGQIFCLPWICST